MAREKTVLVVGAGPAGMMAAGFAAQKGGKVFLLEKNERVGRKLMITGKGRCNITNDCDEDTFIRSVPSNGRFLYSAIHRFTPQDAISFFRSQGLEVKVERGKRVFPVSDKAVDVVDALHRFVKTSGCKILKGEASALIIEDGKVAGVCLSDGRKIFADSVIIACGGLSYPKTGSTGDGYKLARQAGHEIISPKPSLVPLVISNSWCRELQGLALKNIAINVKDCTKNKVVYEDFGELLFTHFGISGPVILSASAHMKDMQPGRYSLSIDLKPALSKEKLDERICRDFLKFQNKSLKNALEALLPKRMIPVVLALLGADAQIKCNSVTKDLRRALVEILKDLRLAVAGFRPISEAIVTAGGVKTSEIDPKTMQSKKVAGLYFAGEVIDVDGYTGGFNLQIAFSTGFLAGNFAVGGTI